MAGNYPDFDRKELVGKNLAGKILDQQQVTEVQAQLIESERLAAISELAGMVGHDFTKSFDSD